MNTLTAAEKAQQLINKFLPHAYPFSAGSRYLSGDIDKEGQLKHAKELAIICVDEILSLLFQHHEIDYWKDVKTELNNL